jgi:hypothetical protein
MGYQFKVLNTREIQERVSSDKVIPSLFWVIPMGDNWNQFELDNAYYSFNDSQNKSRVKLLSNFFVKGDPDAEPNKKRKKGISFSDESNDFVKLLKLAEKKGKNNTKNSNHTKSILLVCSNFPHPGWGLLIKVDELNNLIAKLEEILSDSKFNNIVQLSYDMYESFKILKDIKDCLEYELNSNNCNSTVPNLLNEKQISLQKKHNEYYPIYKNNASRLFEEVMRWSPISLIEIEKSLQFEFDIIAIDEPRMIGWKIASSISSKLSTISFADYLNRDYNAEIEINEINPDEKLDGDVFTDYLHHILVNNSSKYGDKRNVAEKLMNYFNYDQRREIVDFFKLPNEYITDYNNLITQLGWEQPEYEYFDISLVSYFDKSQNGDYFISNKKNESYTRLRESFESYLKDLEKIIKKQLTSDEKEIHQLILAKYPTFRMPKELACTTLCWIIHSLGPIWQRDLNWDEYCKIITQISDILNKDSRVHHNEKIKREDVVVSSLNPLFNEMFKLTNTFFKIMPWHFRPTSNFMRNLYTGMAWSHDVKDKKEIRVLVWENEDEIELGKELLIWNPSKINPVMTNYIKL